MNTKDYFSVFGVYLSPSVYNTLAKHLYEEAGVTEFETYFDSNGSHVSRGDPVGEITHILITRLVENFSSLYEKADFEAASQVSGEEFQLARIAAKPRMKPDAKELFRAASLIQDKSLRVVHTAIFQAMLDEGLLPQLPEDKIRFERG